MTYQDTLLYIDGVLRPAEGGKTYGNVSPIDGEIVGQAADASHKDVDEAIQAARTAFDTTDWPTSVELRTSRLRKFQTELKKLADDYRPRIIAENGASFGLTKAIFMDTPIDIMSWTIDHAESYPYEQDAGVADVWGMRSRRIAIKEAAGVVGAITPWNVPVQINLAKVTAALAAGCTVVLKAAPDTPWGATFLGEAAAAADLPRGVLNVITSSDKVGPGEQLVADARVDLISFTGSTAVGQRIMEAGAATMKRVFLELGGKSANIVLDDADLDEALSSALRMCFNAGQGCSLPSRILLPKSRYEEAIGIIKGLFEAHEYGDPKSPTQMMGPIISRAQLDRVLGYIALGQKEGARLVTGGTADDHRPGYYIKPTLFADVTNDMRIAQEEIFGPVLVAIPYEDEDDAVRIANESKYGLAGYVQSSNDERALRVAKRIRAGSININTGNTFAPDAAFGGFKHSGIGREMGAEGFEEYLESKLVAMPA